MLFRSFSNVLRLDHTLSPSLFTRSLQRVRLRKMAAQSIAVLDDAELKDGQMLVVLSWKVDSRSHVDDLQERG